MKGIATFFPAVLILGAFVGIFVGVSIAREDFGVVGWSFLVVGALVIAWVVAMLFNIAIFAPIYWLIGRSTRRKPETEKPNKPDSQQDQSSEPE